MASIITATTTSGLTQSADNSGVLQLASGTGNLVTIPSVTGTAMVSGNMPAFSAYANNSQTITANTFTKVQINTEEFDTASCFNNTGSTVGGIPSYAFLPNVAGYYQINAQTNGSSTLTLTRIIPAIYKNGTGYKYGNDVTATAARATVSSLVYLNGTTDYIEYYVLLNGTGTLSTGINAILDNYFNGVLVRAA